MQMHSQQNPVSNFQTMNSASLFTAGVACHSIIAASRINLLQKLKETNVTIKQIQEIHAQVNPVVLEGILRSLCYAEVVKKSGDTYSLTALGKEVLRDLPSYVLWFDGYASLLSKQGNICEGVDTFTYQDVDAMIVAENSALIGNQSTDMYLLDALKSLNPTKPICDLGCGNGSRVIKICESFSVDGYGFDISKRAIQEATKKAQSHTNHTFQFFTQDVMNIQGQWLEIEIVMQTFMTHHIVPDERCAEVFASYKNNFPNMRYFIILDVVTSEDDELSPTMFAPGFDYIHRLQGLFPRTKSQMMKTFSSANYSLHKEIKISLPNGYLWILENKKS